MAKAIFTFSESSAYDDQPELRYHFPRTYLRQVNQTIDDWVLYYEPRRTSGPSSSSGRQAYFATARVIRVVPDSDRADHYYAYVSDFMEFDRAGNPIDTTNPVWSRRMVRPTRVCSAVRYARFLKKNFNR